MTPRELPPYAYTWKKCTESEDWEAHCLEIPDLSAYGETPGEALDEIKIAVCSWLEVLEQDGRRFPDPLNVLHAGQVAIKDGTSQPEDGVSQLSPAFQMPSVEMNQSSPTGSPTHMPIQVG